MMAGTMNRQPTKCLIASAEEMPDLNAMSYEEEAEFWQNHEVAPGLVDPTYITSPEQIPDSFPSEEAEIEWWERHSFAPGVMEEGPEVDAELDRLLGIDRTPRRHGR